MKIIIDIGHPAHVHYFKNFINLMSEKGHDFLIIAREKECTFDLLNAYNIPFLSRGKGKKSGIGKLVYMLKADLTILKQALIFKPDLFLSFASPYAAQVAWLLNIPSFTLDDTEHASVAHRFYVPFTKKILTPESFVKDFGKKHHRFNSFIELTHLHSNYFIPDRSIFNLLDIDESTQYIVFRFVAWDANHDWGHGGLSDDLKYKLIDYLSSRYKVFISSEKKLPKQLEKYRLKIPYHKIHDVLYFSKLFIGEGATMASECAMLGTHAIYVNSLSSGTLNIQDKEGLIKEFRGDEGVFDYVIEFLNLSTSRLQEKQIAYSNYIKSLDDPTKFLIDYIEENIN